MLVSLFEFFHVVRKEKEKEYEAYFAIDLAYDMDRIRWLNK